LIDPRADEEIAVYNVNLIINKYYRTINEEFNERFIEPRQSLQSLKIKLADIKNTHEAHEFFTELYRIGARFIGGVERIYDELNSSSEADISKIKSFLYGSSVYRSVNHEFDEFTARVNILLKKDISPTEIDRINDFYVDMKKVYSNYENIFSDIASKYEAIPNLHLKL